MEIESDIFEDEFGDDGSAMRSIHHVNVDNNGRGTISEHNSPRIGQGRQTVVSRTPNQVFELNQPSAMD